MPKITDGLIYDPDPELTAKQMQQSIIAIGRLSYTSGLPRDHATGRFIDPDMSIDWGNGWRWEKEDHEKRKPPCNCAGCIRRRDHA